MLDSKLSKIKELILAKEKIDQELAVLLGDAEKPAKRGRKPKEKPEPMVQSTTV